MSCDRGGNTMIASIGKKTAAATALFGLAFNLLLACSLKAAPPTRGTGER